jgi:hypothetical protein
MPERLVEQYQNGDRVLITFAAKDRWLAGHVVAHDHPGVWVQTADGSLWFVTHPQRIRKATEPGTDG